MKKYIWIVAIFLVVGLIVFAAVFYFKTKKQTTTPTQIPPQQTPVPEAKKEIYPPLDNAKSRIIKKPFGIYITPQTSPIQPERFSGYHTGADFEVTSGELSKNVEVKAICDGKILEKRKLSGYGGVLVQSCTISGRPVTVLYGHVDITSPFVPDVGDSISAGKLLAYLALDKSEYSGGERKHLHLGIHKGEKIDSRGYVQDKNQLSNWIDIKSLLQ